METLKSLAGIIVLVFILIIHCRWMKRKEDEIFSGSDPDGEL